jgi:hypothetical protein
LIIARRLLPFLTRSVQAYWQSQPPDATSPQQDAFSAGSQHVACVDCEQQLAPSCATVSCSCVDADDAPDFSMTTMPI